MKTLLLAGATALALSACDSVNLPGVTQPVTAAQQQCIAINAVTAVKGVDFKAMGTQAKIAFAAEQVDAIGSVCDVHMTPTIEGWIKTAVLLAGS
jgi:uncharacterized lipoprotein YajG